MQHLRNIASLTALLLAFSFSFVPKAQADDVCLPVTETPLLYQIDRQPTQAILYFTPINDQIQSYTIIYGLKAEDERYSITFDSGVSSGAIKYTINDLQSGVQYFYKVRGNTSCTNSPWSAWVGDKAVSKGSATTANLPVTGPEKFMPYFMFTLMTIFGGLGIIAFARQRS